MNDQTARRIATALERLVEQNDDMLAIHASSLDLNTKAVAARQEADETYLGYWKANEERNAAAERRKEDAAAIQAIADSVDRARTIAAAREMLRLLDDDGEPKP